MTEQSDRANHPRVAVATLGCKLNQAESQELAERFAAAGYALAGFDQAADVYVINTCSVTHIADRKSRQLIRQARRANPDALVVVTGCYAEVAPADVAQTDRIDLVVGNPDKNRIVDLVNAERTLRHEAPCQSVTIDAEAVGSRTRAMLKIQEGCNKFCSYCIVPLARGRERSYTIPEAVDEVRRLVAQGRQEVVLTGVNIGAFGHDVPDLGRDGLLRLVEAILRDTTLPRLRLSSIEPEDFDPRLLPLMHGGRLCRHVHLPLQSGSDDVLQAMRRRYSAREFLALVEQVRREVPDAAVTTDIIVGFPGEGDAQFQQTLDVCRQAEFAAAHVFKYSVRRGTRASQLPDQVPYQTKQDRGKTLSRLTAELSRRYRRRFLGQTLDVLYEEALPDECRHPDVTPLWEGLTDNYLRVFTPSDERLANQLHPTRLVTERPAGIAGQLVT